jgi:hypothetical protein
MHTRLARFGAISVINWRWQERRSCQQMAPNLEALRRTKAFTMARKAKKWKWQFSTAKEALRLAILAGTVTEDMSLDDIFMSFPEVALTDRRKFSSRLGALRKQIKLDTGATASDEAAYAHDRALRPAPSHNYRGEPRWEGSIAQELLKLDVAANKQTTMKPKEFYESRLEYTQHYSLKTIREHIYQEVKYVKYCKYLKDHKQKVFRE